MTIRTSIVFILLSLAYAALAKTDELTLTEALDQGLVSVTFTAKGGHEGKCLQMDLQSLHKRDIQLSIPAGTHLASDDTSSQDLMLVKSEETLLAKAGKKRLYIYAVCSQRENAAPGEGDLYAFNGTADGDLLKLADYISTKRYYDKGGAQLAVWILTDGGGLEDLYDDEPKVQKDLQQFMADLTGMPVPWYTKQLTNYEPGPERLTTPAIIRAEYEYKFKELVTIDLAVFNEAGDTIKVIKEGYQIPALHYGLRFTLTVQGLPKGKYYVRLHADGELLDEREMEF